MKYVPLFFLIFATSILCEAAEPGELTALRNSWKAADEKSLKALDEKYIGSLRRSLTKASSKGDLESAVAFRDEIKAVEGDTVRDQSDKGNGSARLADMRIKYQLAVMRQTEPNRRIYLDALKNLRIRFTQEGALESAVAVDREIALISGVLIKARYVRVELPRKGVLCLAEVEVFDNGENIALQGTATHSSTYHGAGRNPIASKAIDGNTSGDFNDGSITHTNHGEENPWWEVDLGATKPVSRVVVWNRVHNNTGERLDGFKLSLLDEKREEVWSKVFPKAPEKEVAVDITP